eukprot:53960-Eustigmatos_ZCMA.PRE.1
MDCSYEASRHSTLPSHAISICTSALTALQPYLRRCIETLTAPVRAAATAVIESTTESTTELTATIGNLHIDLSKLNTPYTA